MNIESATKIQYPPTTVPVFAVGQPILVDPYVGVIEANYDGPLARRHYTIEGIRLVAQEEWNDEVDGSIELIYSGWEYLLIGPKRGKWGWVPEKELLALGYTRRRRVGVKRYTPQS